MEDMQETNRRTIAEYRANRDNPDSPFKNRPLLLLTTIGAKSGQERTTPMMYIRDGDRLLVIASNAGAEKEPDWCRNLRANPRVTVEIGSEVYEATASVTDEAERERLWEQITAQYPFFAEHQAKISRLIPVVALVRHEG